jgi:1,5-anhydro-D-fructose reductase (1,5-anhydro-D-mannitol-forming)
MSAIRVGIIGLGSIGLRMLGAIDEHPAFVATLAFDPSDRAVSRAREGHPQLLIGDDASHVITASEVDIVYIACPPEQHSAHALAARAAGKPVLCEKPLGINLDTSHALVESMAGGAPHGVNFLLAAARGADYIAEKHDLGELGEILAIEIELHLADWARRRYAQAPWLSKSAAGGFLREVASHHVYFASRLLGPLELQHAFVGRTGDPTAAEHFASAFLMAGKVPVTLTGSTQGFGADVNRCVVRGSKASYAIRDLHWLDVATEDGWQAAFEPPEQAERDTHIRQLNRVQRMLEGEVGVTASFADALHVQTLVEGILAFHEGSRPS